MTNMHHFKLCLALIALTICVQTGRANPDEFTVRGVTGTNVFKLSGARGKFVALHFLLKTECPLCLRHTRDYAKKSAGDTNIVHVFLKPDSDEEIKRWAGKLGEDAAGPVIYRDPEARLARDYNIPDGYKFHGQTVHFPALVLLDGKGKEVFRYEGRSNADRFSYERLSTKLKELTKPSSR